MSHTVEVPIENQSSYPVVAGTGLWQELLEFCGMQFSSRQAFLVIDEKVAQLHGEYVESGLSDYFGSVPVFRVPEGEQSKDLKWWNKLVDFLLKEGVERNTPLFAVGGGVTGDLAGFAASTTLRGVPLVHLPTSLLAMVDSSIGGKTGVNHARGKNLIGAFYQPEAVFTDTGFLETLDRKEWINGLSEILKYAAIRRPALFDQLEHTIGEDQFSPSERWTDIIIQSIRIKAEIVSKDTLESGIRAHLNFGHTFGHALEKISGYGSISHGEAVFAGMLAALSASRKLGAELERNRIDHFKMLYDLDLEPYSERIPELIDAMRLDKKIKDNKIHLILLKEWAKPYIKKLDDTLIVEESWQEAITELTA
ncbi:MAG: 3-dehydroquinate synthase [Balneolaceae bacterium]|nr:3-dehydroquinate synthase [Balneolaceae bacterium]